MKLFKLPTYENIIDGPMAHDYKNIEIRQAIKQAYDARYCPVLTPLTHPENYDPFTPPAGWAYDPYYEIWITVNE